MDKDVKVKEVPTGSDKYRARVVSRLRKQYLPEQQEDTLYASDSSVLTPPYNPKSLIDIYERSDALRPCVEAMSVNVDGFGYRLSPRIDLEAEEAGSRARCDVVDAQGGGASKGWSRGDARSP